MRSAPAAATTWCATGKLIRDRPTMLREIIPWYWKRPPKGIPDRPSIRKVALDHIATS
jgi:hypothetical protein